jgi:4a-hydroxytetrahydrobiopterin dehydratase
MTRPGALDAAEVARRCAELDGWRVEEGGGRIAKGFVFRDFSRAFAFMTAVALRAEKLDHHPNWSNVYSKVDVSLWTHSAGGVTDLDFRLATFMEEVARDF